MGLIGWPWMLLFYRHGHHYFGGIPTGRLLEFKRLLAFQGIVGTPTVNGYMGVYTRLLFCPKSSKKLHFLFKEGHCSIIFCSPLVSYIVLLALLGFWTSQLAFKVKKWGASPLIFVFLRSHQLLGGVCSPFACFFFFFNEVWRSWWLAKLGIQYDCDLLTPG